MGNVLPVKVSLEGRTINISNMFIVFHGHDENRVFVMGTERGLWEMESFVERFPFSQINQAGF